MTKKNTKNTNKELADNETQKIVGAGLTQADLDKFDQTIEQSAAHAKQSRDAFFDSQIGFKLPNFPK